jgi:hypothetical protein
MIGLPQYHKDAQLHIYDALGNEVFQNASFSPDEEVDISRWSSGVYTVRILSADGQVTMKFVKE